MKKNLMIPLWLLAAAIVPTGRAAINVSGSLGYSQSFDSLPTAATRSEFSWTDNVTLPGFYLHRSNTPTGQTSLAGTLATAGARPYISSGAEVATTAPNFHGFLNLGTYSSTDRALGFCPTTSDGTTNWAGGTLSVIALFTNTGTKSLDITDVSYFVENWRANSDTTVSETISCFYKIGDAAALLAELGTATASATFTQPGYALLNGGSLDLLSTDGFSNPTPPGRTERSASLVPALRIAPGQSIVIRWSDANDGGADAQVGIDDLFVNFVEVASSISPTVSSVVRQDSGTATTPGDDKVDFTLNVAGLGAVSPSGWRITFPPSLAGTTGAYGTPKAITGVDINDFSGPTHRIDVQIEDQGDPATNAVAPLIAPWGTITPVITNILRNTKATDDPTDDEWTYTLTVNGQFTGTSWTSTNSSFPTGTYGATLNSASLPIAISPDTITLTDTLDSSITTTVDVFPPIAIGKKNFGVEEKLFSGAGGVPVAWVTDETALTQKMNNGGGAPPKVYRSEVIDLTAIGTVKFTGVLQVDDTSSGNEAGDTFNAQLIIDGTTTVSLITPYDTLTPADGVLTGAEITPASVGPPPATGAGNFTHTLSAVIPDTANSVQLVISGNNDSASESFTVKDLKFELADHSIIATALGPVFDNKGTLTPDDDVYFEKVMITGVSAPAGSTGWTSNLTPAAGLYSDAQPVLFGPFTLAGGPQQLILTDNGVPTVTTTVNFTPPAPTIIVRFVSGTVFRNNAGFADDTTTINFEVSASVGSTAFKVDAHPLVSDSATYALTATPTTIAITFSGAPDHGALDFVLSDAAYPNSRGTIGVTFPAAVLTQYILGTKDFGAGESSFLSLSTAALPTEWVNFNNPPALMMNNGGGPATKVITSEVIDLSGVGAARFTAKLHARDTSSGFEADESFLAQLIYDGNTAAPVNLITPFDTNADGVMTGDELCPAPVTAGTPQDREYAISQDIPDSVNSVQLVVTAATNSGSETIYFENMKFALATTVVDTDSDGMPDDYEDANGLDKNSNADKDTDLDGDGQSNLNEYLAGTAANSSASALRVTGLQKTTTTASITWSSVPGKTYRVDISPNLGSWTDAGLDFPAAAAPAAETTATVNIPAPAPGKYYLRVRVK